MIESSGNIKNLELWNLFLSGNRDALGKLYEGLFPKLFLFAYYFTNNKEQAKDLTQDAFEKLIRKKDMELYNIEGWLRNSIRYSWKTKNRDKHSRRRHLVKYKETISCETQIQTSLDAEIHQKTIESSLTKTNARVITLVSEGYNNLEIAEKLGITEKQVRNRKYESRKKLKNRFWKKESPSS